MRRTAKKECLDLEPKRIIFQFIQEHPGLHLREISRKLEIPKSSLVYHINYLGKRELIVSRNGDRYKRFYVADKFGVMEKKYLGLLQHPINGKILLFLCLFDVRSQKQIFKFIKEGCKFDKYQTTIAFHLNNLEKKGILHRFTHGNETKYMINPKERGQLIDLIIVNKNSFFDKRLVKKILFYMDEIPKDYIDKLVRICYDIFPHPYHV